MADLELESDDGSEVPPSTAVVEAIAEHEGLDPLALETPLYEVIDTDALDSIIGSGVASHRRSDVTVQFSYNSSRVRISGDGSVEVEPVE
jgi:hypothetical protein